MLIPYLAPDQVRARGGTKEAACALQQLGAGITSAANDPSASQSVFTITDKAPTRRRLQEFMLTNLPVPISHLLIVGSTPV